MSMPRAVRHINEVRVLDALFRHGVTTRADLARELGLMRSTVGNLIVGLIEQGLVRETDLGTATGTPVAAKTGRPGQGVHLNAGHAAFIGADIGVGHLSVVVIDLAGRTVHSRTLDWRAEIGAVDAVVDRLAEMVEGVMRQLPSGQVVQGLNLTVPGLVTSDGVVLRAPVLGWQQVPVQRLLVERLGWHRPISAENDANAFAAAELFGRDQPPGAEALFVYLDAGVGGGIASAGRLLRGQRGQAGEIGHIHLGEHGFETRTAVQGSFESYVGREAVLARFQHHGGEAEGLDAFLAALDAGLPAAQRTLSDWAWWMGRGLASLISVLDPGRIVLGGPVAALFEPARGQVLDSIRKHLVPPHDLPVIEVSTLTVNACALGGAMLLHRAHLAIDERLVFGASGPGG
ncbi:ROK family transcriptional regulator [Sphaerotilus mobilis]|uniref:Putative NBD/HSP70 family sugar kinase n=1 Tax=Sphaerotilus mobilis TaxID=47994 RepID=A0A4Q7LHK8_9BURK|nr:ROK family transcriptional regulator [Sphaerotilus mobilis]RZS52918.1 putative NBD/HSP70 family sugar kinase [Sphaerotilus mobilis]